MGNIIGLDLGTNSIGWSVINNEAILNKKEKFIKAAGSRVIPMDAKTISDYESGNLKSAASARTKLRAIRRLYQRAVLRRERLLRVLNILGFLPTDFKENIDFEKNLGQYKNGTEPLIAYYKDKHGRNRFRFQEAFLEMIEDFEKSHPELVDKQRKIPHDWTLYYLRHKALTKKISKEELAWVLLSYNAKRGYNQLRRLKNNENDDSKQKTFERLTVKNVAVDDNRVKSQNGKQKYIVTYNNGCTQTFTSVEPPYKIGDTVNCILTKTLNAKGSIKTDKDGNPKISVSTPGEDDWTLIKAKTESDIEKSKEYVSTYIYKNLLLSPTIKIKGSLVGTIDRKFYKEELQAILKTQIDFRQELKDKELYSRCVEELYKNSINHRETLLKHDIVDFIVNDIIFYQRPLKTKKYLIANCPYEAYHYYKDNNLQTKPIKCIPKSHPLFQEFRIWQFLSNVKIFKRIERIDDRIRTDVEVTSTYINGTTYEKLYENLSEIAEVSQSSFLKMFGLKSDDYRWNYEDDNAKKYPCNSTKATIIKALNKIGIKSIEESDLLKLWHILYSVDDPIEIKTALMNFAEKCGWDKNIDIDKNTFADNLAKTTLSEDGYGAYSEKAIKKLLALMRYGKYWNDDNNNDGNNIDSGTKEKIKKIIDGNISELGLPEKAITRLNELKEIKDFQGLPLWLACYIVYGRHSESSDSTHWKSPEDIDAYINNEFKPHCLRNPVVEMIVLEALKIIRDIWETYGEISEIHVEIGRDLKNNSKERKRIASKIRGNEKTNKDIRQKIIKHFGDDYRVSHNDIVRYKLAEEQKWRSPYTGEGFGMNDLFSSEYQIDHIIPQAKYFDDSISNKVLCESEVNRTKGARLGYEFIIKDEENEINIGGGKSCTILTKEAYENFVRQHYASNPLKLKKLLMEDIPDDFTARQLNDTRYMSRKIIEILSKLVRTDDEKEAVSKNVIVTSGSITDRLKNDWGLNDIWNRIVTPRFERLNELDNNNTNRFGSWTDENGKQYFQTDVPPEFSSGFSKKRIDHRHHAMDAIVIACTSRNIVNYLNNVSANDSLKRSVCRKRNGSYSRNIKVPWDTFAKDVSTALGNIIVSFKQNRRILTRTSNRYTRYNKDGIKILDRQCKGELYAIRKSLHKDHVFGKVSIPKPVALKDAIAKADMIVNKKIRLEIEEYLSNGYDVSKIVRIFKDRNISTIEVYETKAAIREPLNAQFTKDKIERVTDSGIKEILRKHLERCDNNPEIAFSPQGIKKMNDNIKDLNNDKDHKPIYNVRVSDVLGAKFPIGSCGAKSKKFVISGKEANLFFAVYSSDSGERSYESITLREAIICIKEKLPIAKEVRENGDKLLFILSPNDLVYVSDSDSDAPLSTENINKDNIYKMVSCQGNRCFFIKHNIAKPIADKFEFTTQNKIENLPDGRSIKKYCHKISIDRLGNIKKK